MQPPENLGVRIETVAGSQVDFAFTGVSGAFEFRDVELRPNESHYIVVEAPGFETFRERLDYMVDTRRGGYVTINLREERASPSVDSSDDGSNVVDLSQFLAEVPDEARREYDRALEDARDGRWDDAVERLERVVSLAPDFFPGFDRLGTAYLAVGRRPEAEVALTRALQLSPGAARPLLNLGTLAYQEGEDYLEGEQFDDASRAFVRAVGLLEESVRREPREALAFHHLGAALYRVGEYARAEESLLEALRLNPAVQDARLPPTDVYTRQRRYDDALEQLDLYGRDNPESDRLPALERVREQIESAQAR